MGIDADKNMIDFLVAVLSKSPEQRREMVKVVVLLDAHEILREIAPEEKGPAYYVYLKARSIMAALGASEAQIDKFASEKPPFDAGAM